MHNRKWIKKLNWVVTRASRMSTPEVFHRIREIYLKNRLTQNPFGVLRNFEIPRIDWMRIETSASKYSSRHFKSSLLNSQIYGFPWPTSEDGSISWNSFFEGTDTSHIPAFKVPYRNREILSQDVRFSWELNRLTWLLKLAVFGNQEEQDQAANWFRDFLRTDKVGFGLRWNSMIELAIQAILIQSILSALEVKLTDHDFDLSNQALSHRYHWLRKLPSKYSSANNHRIAELVSLIALAESSADRVSSDTWQNELIKELSKQINSDGLNAELSADYHLFVLDLLITLCTLCQNLRYSDQLNSAIKKMATATNELRTLNQIWPSFGDSDEAAIIGILVPRLQRAEFLEELSGFSSETRDEGIGIKARTFEVSGFSVVKSKSLNSIVSLLVDHGQIGFGKISAHGHADTLALWLVVNEIPVLVEAGTFSYHSSESLRNLLRSGWMHNTLTIDGESLSKPSGPFLWRPSLSAKAELLACKVLGKTVQISMIAQYPRTSQRKKGAVRRIVNFSENTVEVLDSISSNGAIESHFIISPLFKLTRGNSSHEVSLTSEHGIKVVFRTPYSNTIKVEQIEISPSYGSLVSTNRISIAGSKTNEISIHLEIEKT